ncbi:MAG TPA: hypothetical protein VFX59_17795 [Polyangiales bacterium]|nr:hypothetical protein [Polyangiales bacterium]
MQSPTETIRPVDDLDNKPAPPRGLARLKAHPFDCAGLLFTSVFWAPSVIYPLGPDQSLFFYIGRLWFSGALPYRDAVDQKPPGIFAIYGLATALFGANQYAIHIAELLAIFAMGWCCTRVIEANKAPRDGVFGLSCVVLAALYLICFDYWSMGQVEIWQGGFSLASFTAVICGVRRDRRALTGGVLGGVATLFKPSPPLLVAGVICALRAARAETGMRNRAVAVPRALALYGAGTFAVFALTLLPFALSRRGLLSMRECMIDFTKAYTTEWVEVFNLDWPRVGAASVAVYVLLALGIGISLERRDSRALRVGLSCVAMIVLALATVYVQRKYLGYHWVLLLPFFALGATWGLNMASTSPRGALIGTMFSVSLYIVVGLWLSGPFAYIYASQVRNAYQLTRGELAWSDYARTFGGPFGNDYGALEHLGNTVNALARPGDTLCVRGYIPVVYVVTGLRCPSRFPWEQHIGNVWEPPVSKYPEGDVRNAWIKQHTDALARNPPSFVVTFAVWPADRAQLRAHGYREVIEERGIVLLEKARPDVGDGATATASGEYAPVRAAALAIDGDYGSEWLLPDYTLGYLDVTFERPRDVHRVRLVNGHNAPYNDRAIQSAKILVIENDRVVDRAEVLFEQFTKTIDARVVELAGKRATRVRVAVTGHFGLGASLAELRVE